MNGILKFHTVVVAGSVHVQNNFFFENSISSERGVFLLYNNNVCITSNFKFLVTSGSFQMFGRSRALRGETRFEVCLFSVRAAA